MVSLSKFYSEVYNFVFVKHYWIFLAVVVLISYGQILGMGVWKDDNAIFFKFDHIYEQAGFFGKGILGEGPYKFSVTPYYPIHLIFGNESIVPYYVLILIFYFVSTLCVYFLFSRLFSKSLGKVSAFLFAAGYISSQGFFWLATAMFSNLSIVVISLIILLYNAFLTKRKILYYLLAVFLYWLCVAFFPLRAYYFIAFILSFELIFAAFKKFPKSLIGSFVRSLPFVGIFYYYFLFSSDSRTALVKDYVLSLLRGEFYKTFSFFTSLSNVVIPNNYINFILTKLPHAEIILIIFFCIFYYTLFVKSKKRLTLTFVSLILTLVWFVASKEVFNSPVLSLSRNNLFIVFMGGMVLFNLFLFYFVIEKEKKKLFILLSLWLLISISAYAAYQPTAFFNTIHHYFTNSFFALVGILGLLYLYFRERNDNFGKVFSKIIIFWGILNLISSFYYQNHLLKTRSIPVGNFYRELKTYLPQIKKGDILYFDVGEGARSYFESAFSVSSMPESTALAWRYSVDRYDFYLASEPPEFIKIAGQNISNLDNLHTFFYGKAGLENTTGISKKLISGKNYQTSFKNVNLQNKYDFEYRNDQTYGKPSDIIFDLPKKVESTFPVRVSFRIAAFMSGVDELKPPYVQNLSMLRNPIANKDSLRKQAFECGKRKEMIMQNTKVKFSSEWKERVGKNLLDNDFSTAWQSDRILWGSEDTFLELDFDQPIVLGEFAWVNAFENNTPTNYFLESSLDGINWKKDKEIESIKRIGTTSPKVVKMDSIQARFVRMHILKTINNDSPAISEIWVTPSSCLDLDTLEIGEFLSDPFGYIPDGKSYFDTLNSVSNKGKVMVFWKNNKKESWQTNSKNTIDIYYDNISRFYSYIIPAGGTRLSAIKLSGGNIPGVINLYDLTFIPMTLSEWLQYEKIN